MVARLGPRGASSGGSGAVVYVAPLTQAAVTASGDDVAEARISRRVGCATSAGIGTVREPDDRAPNSQRLQAVALTRRRDGSVDRDDCDRGVGLGEQPLHDVPAADRERAVVVVRADHDQAGAVRGIGQCRDGVSSTAGVIVK
jgi:hypothetical protein